MQEANTEEIKVKQQWYMSGKVLYSIPFTEIPMLLKPILPKVGLAALAGSSDVGKSYLLLQLSIAIINGDTSFLGLQLSPDTKRVLFVCTEDDEYSLSHRIKSMDVHSEQKMESIDFAFHTEKLDTNIEKYLATNKVDLIVIDTFADIFTGNLNMVNDVRAFLQKFSEIAQKHKCLILFNHHCGKRNEEKYPSKDNVLGSQGFEAKMRLVLELRRDPNNSTLRHLCILKGNNLDDEIKQKSIELSFVHKAGFIETGRRMPFKDLVKTPTVDKDSAEVISIVQDLKTKGLSYRQISDELNKVGVSIGKTKVGEILKNKQLSVPNNQEKNADGQELSNNKTTIS